MLTTPIARESALLTIDVQEDFARPGAPAEIPGTGRCIPAMRRVLDAYRKHGLPIVHVVRLYLADGSNADLCRREAIGGGRGIVTPGSDGAELVAELKPDPAARLDAGMLLRGGFQELGANEWAMYKPRWDAFHRTPLEEHLRSLRVTAVSAIGCNFPNCPRATVYGASMRDFRVAIFTDAISGIYDRGLRELENIGVTAMESEDCAEWLEEGVGGENSRRADSVFDRYTEKARRAVFFARYEAGHLGSASIEPEHMLLGLMRDAAAPLAQIPQKVRDEIRAEIEAAAPRGTAIPDAADLPLSSPLKRALVRGAREAERSGRKHVDVEHLLFGLLAKDDSSVPRILRRHGINREGFQPPGV